MRQHTTHSGGLGASLTFLVMAIYSSCTATITLRDCSAEAVQPARRASRRRLRAFLEPAPLGPRFGKGSLVRALAVVAPIPGGPQPFLEGRGVLSQVSLQPQKPRAAEGDGAKLDGPPAGPVQR